MVSKEDWDIISVYRPSGSDVVSVKESYETDRVISMASARSLYWYRINSRPSKVTLTCSRRRLPYLFHRFENHGRIHSSK